MNKKKIIIIIAIIITICIVMVIVSADKKNTENKYNKGTPPKADIIDPKEDGILNLSGFSIFFDEYTGEFMASEIGYFMEDIYTSYIPKLYDDTKNCNNTQLEEYYKNNSIDIRRFLGHGNKEEFIEFVDKLKNSNVEFSNYDRVVLLTDTFVNISEKEGYSYIEYTFSDVKENTMKFSLYVSHEKSKVPNFIITAID